MADRYAFACAQCRQRKIKCDGEQPSCRKCRQAHTTCHYAQRTTESRLERANARIQQLEAELTRTRQITSPVSSTASGARPRALSDVSLVSNQRTVLDNETALEPEDISPHVGLDEHGDITFHGPTSRFSAGGVEDNKSHKSYRYSQSDHVAALQSNLDMLHQVWEPLLESKTTDDLGADPGLVHRLLNEFWIWQHPLHNYVYRPCFIMDMALGGPYYSKFLLNCILALSARHLDPKNIDNEVAHKGETFLSAAKTLLVDELGATKPKIPTIQGLLILGGRQCAVGKTSEGWLYTGMAIRMMTDLGLHLNFEQMMHLEKLSPVELEVRKRLYCSAYIWDKSLSLTLGRLPSVTRLPAPALDFLDHADDMYLWAPMGDYTDYPGEEARQTTCFRQFCLLGSIIELIMSPVPSGTSIATLRDRLSKIQDKLHHWHEQLPTSLKMNAPCETCPPPHILSLNLLYNTLHIITWRPYMDVPSTASHATEICINSARTVYDMFIVYGRTFQWRKMTYLVSYCVYTAATVDVHEMRASDMKRRKDAAQRLAVSLQILESESKQTPGIRRSIDIIKRQLRTWTPSKHDETRAAHGISESHQRITRLAAEARSDSSVPQQRDQEPTASSAQAIERDFDSTWNMYPGFYNEVTGTDFGFGVLDTSAGFTVPWSFDDSSDFNFLDSPFNGNAVT